MRSVILVAALLLAGTASADQFAYNTLPDAVKGLQKVDGLTEVRHFCAPCSGDKARTEALRDVAIDLVWDRDARAKPYRDGANQYWELYLNGKPVDMAYVYIRENGKWRNLAIAIGLQPSSVPEFIR